MLRVACMLSTTALLGLAAPGGALQAAPPEPAAALGHYTLDKSRSSLAARVTQLGVVSHTLRFERFDGTLEVAADSTASKVEVVVDATSADAGSSKFDKEVADEILDPARFPQMKFVSTGIERTGPSTGNIHGDLTFRGVTRPVTLDARIIAAAPGADGRPRVGVTATGSFKRSEFGATEFLALASDDVQLQIEAEFSQ